MWPPMSVLSLCLGIFSMHCERKNCALQSEEMEGSSLGREDIYFQKWKEEDKSTSPSLPHLLPSPRPQAGSSEDRPFLKHIMFFLPLCLWAGCS